MKSELITSLLVDFESCKDASVEIKDLFPDIRKKVNLAKGPERAFNDMLFTRYAA